MENQPEKGHLHTGSGQSFKHGLLKLYGRGRKVLFPHLKWQLEYRGKGCLPLFTQLLSPNTAM